MFITAISWESHILSPRALPCQSFKKWEHRRYVTTPFVRLGAFDWYNVKKYLWRVLRGSGCHLQLPSAPPRDSSDERPRWHRPRPRGQCQCHCTRWPSNPRCSTPTARPSLSLFSVSRPRPDRELATSVASQQPHWAHHIDSTEWLLQIITDYIGWEWKYYWIISETRKQQPCCVKVTLNNATVFVFYEKKLPAFSFQLT